MTNDVAKQESKDVSQNINRNESEGGSQNVSKDMTQGQEASRQEQNALPSIRPATDILEKEDGFHIYMDLPGVAKEDLEIDLNENELKVRATAKGLKREGAKEAHMEFAPVEYVRSFTISDEVDRGRIDANLEKGVLELHLPKTEKAKPKRIDITTG